MRLDLDLALRISAAGYLVGSAIGMLMHGRCVPALPAIAVAAVIMLDLLAAERAA